MSDVFLEWDEDSEEDIIIGEGNTEILIFY